MKKSSVSIDSSCLIALQANEELGNRFKERAKQDWDVYCSEFAILETFYVLCRKFGIGIAEQKVTSLKESGVIQIEPIITLSKDAALIKCQRPIAIGDCFTIALARKINGDAIFCKKEQELKKALDKQPFDVNVLFFEDLI